MQRSIFATCLIACLTILTGCGGGGGSSAAGGPTLIPDTIVFSTGKTGPVSSTAKNADEDTLSAVMDASFGQDNLTQAMNILNKMKTMPDFSEGGISANGTTFGKFTDGTEYMFATGDPEINSATATAAKTRAPLNPQFQVATLHPSEQPGSPQAYVFNAMEAKRHSPTSDIAAALGKQGYTVHTGTASLQDWSHIARAGILVFDGHGGAHDGTYWLETSDIPDDVLDYQYRDEIDHGIEKGSVSVLDNTSVGHHDEKRYWISIDFLRSTDGFSTMFDTNSLFYNLACEGTGFEAYLLFSLLESKSGLGVYGGWTNSVRTNDSNESAAFFFDRALGLNTVAPVDPDSPTPASWTSLQGILSKTKHQNGHTYPMDQSHVTIGGKEVVVDFKLFQAETQALTTIIPSISNATVSSDNLTLDITGDFGPDKGTVTVNGTAQNITSWAKDAITIPKPSTGGSLLITNPIGLKSNTFTLGGVLSVTPPAQTITTADTQKFTAVIAGALTGQTYSYQWTNTGNFGAIADGSGHTTNSFTTDDAFVTYTPMVGKTGTDTITVEAFIKTSSGQESIGKKTASVTVSPTLSTITPRAPTVGYDTVNTFTVAPVTGKYPDGVTFTWTLAGKGSLGSANPVTTSTPTITYTAPHQDSTDTLTVKVKDSKGNLVSSGGTNITVKVVGLTFSIAPQNPFVPQFLPVDMVVIAGTTPFPANSRFRWTVTGQGTINGTNPTITTTTRVNYIAPNAETSNVVTVEVLDPQNNVLGTTFTTVGVGSLGYVTFDCTKINGDPFFTLRHYYDQIKVQPSIRKYSSTLDMMSMQYDITQIQYGNPVRDLTLSLSYWLPTHTKLITGEYYSVFGSQISAGNFSMDYATYMYVRAIYHMSATKDYVAFTFENRAGAWLDGNGAFTIEYGY